MPQQEDYLGTIPVGKLGIIALESSKGIAKKVDDYIVDWREARNHEHTETIHFNELVRVSVPVKQRLSFVSPSGATTYIFW